MRSALLLAPLLGCAAPNPEYRGTDGGSVDVTAAGDGTWATVPDGTGGALRDSAPGDPPGRVPAPPGPLSRGLLLYWRLDEPTGTVAFDSSEHLLDGQYSGAGPSTQAAPTKFANPGSRVFEAAAGHSVQLGSPPAALRPTQAVTVSVWFRTTISSRGDLGGLGADYFLRYDAGNLQFVRRRPAGSSVVYLNASGPAPAANDGRWHHVAGVATDRETMIYLDGTLLDTDRDPIPFTYQPTGVFLVGRSASSGLPFSGWLDDVRVYDRALSTDEIRALARGED